MYLPIGEIDIYEAIEILTTIIMIPILTVALYSLNRAYKYYKESAVRYLTISLYILDIGLLIYSAVMFIAILMLPGFKGLIGSYGRALVTAAIYAMAFYLWKFRPTSTASKESKDVIDILRKTPTDALPCIPHIVLISKSVKDPSVRNSISYSSGKIVGYSLVNNLKGTHVNLWSFTNKVSKLLGLKLIFKIINSTRQVIFEASKSSFSLADVEAISNYIKGIFEVVLERLFNQRVTISITIDAKADKYLINLKF